MSTQQHITIDGTQYRFSKRRDDSSGSGAQRHKDTDPVLPERHDTHRRLPHVPGRGRGCPEPCGLMRNTGFTGHGCQERIRAGNEIPQENLQLLLSSGHHYCVTCEADGDCRLQSLAYEYKIDTIDYREAPQKHPVEVNTLITRDFSRCIMCGCCVQACNEVQVNQAISFGYRGVASKIVATGDRAYADSDCVFCGECVRVCPVGALVETQSRFKGKVRRICRE